MEGVKCWKEKGVMYYIFMVFGLGYIDVCDYFKLVIEFKEWLEVL